MFILPGRTNYVPQPPPTRPPPPTTSLTVDDFHWSAFLPKNSRKTKTVREYLQDIQTGAPEHVYRFARTWEQRKAFGCVHRANGGFSYRHNPYEIAALDGGLPGGRWSTPLSARQSTGTSRATDRLGASAVGLSSSAAAAVPQTAREPYVHCFPPRDTISRATTRLDDDNAVSHRGVSRASNKHAMPPRTAGGTDATAAQEHPAGGATEPLVIDPSYIELRKLDFTSSVAALNSMKDFAPHGIAVERGCAPPTTPRLPARFRHDRKKGAGAAQQQAPSALDGEGEFFPPLALQAVGGTAYLALPDDAEFNSLFRVPLPEISKKNKKRLSVPTIPPASLEC